MPRQMLARYAALLEHESRSAKVSLQSLAASHPKSINSSGYGVTYVVLGFGSFGCVHWDLPCGETRRRDIAASAADSEEIGLPSPAPFLLRARLFARLLKVHSATYNRLNAPRNRTFDAGLGDSSVPQAAGELHLRTGPFTDSPVPAAWSIAAPRSESRDRT